MRIGLTIVGTTNIQIYYKYIILHYNMLNGTTLQ